MALFPPASNSSSPRPHRAALLLGIVLATLASASAVDAALIKLRPTATAATSLIRLGDVAEVLDADAERAARLAHITLAPAPAAGRSLRLDFATIRDRLASQGVALQSLEFSGASVVTIAAEAAPTKDATPLKPVLPSDLARRRAEDELCRAIADYVQSQARELGLVHVQVQLDRELGHRLAVGGAPRYEVAGGQAPWTGIQQFRVRLGDDTPSTTPRELLVQAQVMPLPQVVVSRVNAPRGHIFRASDLQWQQVTELPEAPVASLRPEEVIGQEAVRAVRAGAPLTEHDLRSVPLIRRGDIVTVYARRPGVAVRMEAKAHSDGARGEQVQLVSLDGRQKLVARVTGFHEAEVVPLSPVEQAEPAPSDLRLTISER